jgi:hypothetical protein
MYAARMELHDYSNDQATWCCRGCDTFPYLNVAALREERNQYEILSGFRYLKVFNGKDSYGVNPTNGDARCLAKLY